MCGILGSINIGGTNSYLKEIKHRGPDSCGQQNFDVGEHKVSLLHHRLSIVDLSPAGHQPMSSLDGQAHIIFNGEIYNHLELKKELKSITFKGHSDTETILNYIKTKNIRGSVLKLNGIFGFAYLDLEEKKLFLVRDRFGVKPVYYHFENEQVLFSSEIRPLKSHLKPAINVGKALISQKMRFTPSPLTLYQGISKVEPGQIIEFDLNEKEIRMKKSYYLEKPKLGGISGDFEKLSQEYGDLFEKAVQRQLMADVDVGILLSGGIDSALVASIARQKSSGSIKAFTIGFEGDHTELDEVEYAQETAHILGLEHYVKKIGFTDFLSVMAKAVHIVEEPIGTTSIIPMFFLSQLAASQVKVVLSGQGADEPLGGYNKYKALTKLQALKTLPIPFALIECFDFLYSKKEYIRRFITAVPPRNIVSSWLAFNAVSSDHELRALLNPSCSDKNMKALKEYQINIQKQWNERISADESLKNLFPYLDMHTSLADDLLMYTDKLTMNFGLECRVPILDNDLISFVQSLESSFKFNSNKGKIIHKHFAKNYLPSSIIERKKLNFRSPTEEWFRKYTGQIEEVFSQNDTFKEVFDYGKVKELLARHNHGQNLEKQIFLLLSLNYLQTNNV